MKTTYDEFKEIHAKIHHNHTSENLKQKKSLKSSWRETTHYLEDGDNFNAIIFLIQTHPCQKEVAQYFLFQFQCQFQRRTIQDSIQKKYTSEVKVKLRHTQIQELRQFVISRATLKKQLRKDLQSLR